MTIQRPLRIPIFTLLTILVLLTTTCIKDQLSIQDSSPAKKPWTFMFYCDEDFYIYYHRFELFTEAMCSGNNLNVIVLHDTYEDPAILYYVDENHRPLPKVEMGEINMGSYETLRDFVDYGKKHYPAERYILGLYDHGAGWIGTCWDLTNDSDWLTPEELYRALNESGGIDLFMFAAACRMGAFEVAYEIREMAEVYIGSENRTSYWFWENPMERICQTLHDSPEVSTVELSEHIIDFIRVNNFTPSPFQDGLTTSSVYLEKLDTLKQAIDEVALFYQSNPAAFKSYMSVVYKEMMAYNNSSVDIYDFAHELLNVETDSLRRSQLEKIQKCLQDAIIANCCSEGLDGSHGLSIYLPDPEEEPYNLMYHNQEFGLDFTQNSHWDELLRSYFSLSGGQQKNMPVEQEAEIRFKD